MADHADGHVSGGHHGGQVSNDVMLFMAMAIPGWMSSGELQWLYQMATQRRMILEIGTWYGRSAKALALGTPGVVFCVDHWRGAASEMGAYSSELLSHGSDGVRLQCIQNLQPQVDQKKVVLLNIDIQSKLSQGVLHMLFATTRPDMIFIDGEHTTDAVCADIKLALEIAAPHALICGHDYNRDEVQVAVQSQFDAAITPIQRGPDRIWFVQLP